jgi:hypothetical protein
MSDIGKEIPQEALQSQVKKPGVRAQAEEEDQAGMNVEELSHLVTSAIAKEAELDPAFARKLNEIAVQATAAAERLIDQKQLWKTASFAGKLKLLPGMARAVTLMGLCNTLTQGIYAGVTERAIAQAKQEGQITPDWVQRLSAGMRQEGFLLGERQPVKPPMPQVQPPAPIVPPMPKR